MWIEPSCQISSENSRAIRLKPARLMVLAMLAGITAIASLSTALFNHQSGSSVGEIDRSERAVVRMQTMHAAAGAPGLRPATIVRPISCERLPNVPGKSITTAMVDFPPKGYTPRIAIPAPSWR